MGGKNIKYYFEHLDYQIEYGFKNEGREKPFVFSLTKKSDKEFTDEHLYSLYLDIGLITDGLFYGNFSQSFDCEIIDDMFINNTQFYLNLRDVDFFKRNKSKIISNFQNQLIDIIDSFDVFFNS